LCLTVCLWSDMADKEKLHLDHNLNSSHRGKKNHTCLGQNIITFFSSSLSKQREFLQN